MTMPPLTTHRLPAMELAPGDKIAIRHLPHCQAVVVRKGGDGSVTAVMEPAHIDIAIRELSRWRLGRA